MQTKIGEIAEKPITLSKILIKITVNDKEILNTWLLNLYLEIEELSDIDYQRKLWFGKIPGLISDFIELYCRLFYDYNLDLFIDEELPKLGVSQEFIDEIKLLRTSLNSYWEEKHPRRFPYFIKNYRKCPSNNAVLDDPEWHKVSDQAKIVRSYWEKELGVPSQSKD